MAWGSIDSETGGFYKSGHCSRQRLKRLDLKQCDRLGHTLEHRGRGVPAQDLCT